VKERKKKKIPFSHKPYGNKEKQVDYLLFLRESRLFLKKYGNCIAFYPFSLI